MRGHAVSVWGQDVAWVPVVVLDHPAPPDDLIPQGEAVVILRRDWEFLFDQLQSTVAVVDYLHRVAALDRVALGMEPVRYYELAQADASADPGSGNDAFADLFQRTESAPTLPLTPAQPANLVRWILEDVADVPIGDHDDAWARHRLDMLAAIDSAPILTRELMADAILRWLAEVQKAPSEAVWWRFRHYLYFGRVHLIVGVTNQNREEMREAFGHLVRLRHVERGERSKVDAELKTVGVLLQPGHDGRRPWDTTAAMVKGIVTLGAEERAISERLWLPIEVAAERARQTSEGKPFGAAEAGSGEVGEVLGQ